MQYFQVVKVSFWQQSNLCDDVDALHCFLFRRRCLLRKRQDLMARAGANGLDTITNLEKMAIKIPVHDSGRAMAPSNRLRRPFRVSPAGVHLIN